jgi:hypothetical protein
VRGIFPSSHRPSDSFYSSRIEMADEEVLNATQREGENNEFDFMPVTSRTLRDWRFFFSCSRQQGLM